MIKYSIVIYSRDYKIVFKSIKIFYNIDCAIDYGVNFFNSLIIKEGYWAIYEETYKKLL